MSTAEVVLLEVASAVVALVALNAGPDSIIARSWYAISDPWRTFCMWAARTARQRASRT